MRPLISLVCLILPAALAVAAPAIYPFGNAFGKMPAPEAAKLAKELGYQGIGSIYPNRLADYKAACEAEGFTLCSIYVGGKVNADGFQADSNIPAAIAMLKGTDALVELNVQRGENPNDEQAVALVRHVGELAGQAGLKVVIYPHADCHIERVDHAFRIAKATGRDNVGVAFNLCHFLKLQKAAEIPAALAAAKPLLWSVSISGADLEGRDWNTLIRPLDEGTFDPSTLLWTLRRMDYTGAVGLQCFNIRIAPRDHLSRSITAWRKHLHTAGM